MGRLRFILELILWTNYELLCFLISIHLCFIKLGAQNNPPTKICYDYRILCLISRQQQYFCDYRITHYCGSIRVWRFKERVSSSVIPANKRLSINELAWIVGIACKVRLLLLYLIVLIFPPPVLMYRGFKLEHQLDIPLMEAIRQRLGVTGPF